MPAETQPTYEETNVRHVRVSAYCKTHNYALGWDGLTMLVSPPRYRHFCKEGCEYVLFKVYPSVELRDVY